MKIYGDLRKAIIGGWQYTLDYGRLVDQSHWQGIEAPKKTIEAIDFMFRAPMPKTVNDAQALIDPNLPWADVHFQERISAIPFNPPPSNEIWPFAQNGNKQFKSQDKFHHTYPERFWPNHSPDGKYHGKTFGIRWQYGDLEDLIDKLESDPRTRQAYLPIWFPEDTGKDNNIRVPCTLGYHFMIRDNRLDIKYIMRSTDMLRHFQDDIYMAFRLAKYVFSRVKENIGAHHLGYMTFITFSAHVFEDELTILQSKIKKYVRNH